MTQSADSRDSSRTPDVSSSSSSSVAPADAFPVSFPRIDRLPPYVFNITAELKMAARRRGEDIIDMSMGNPDGATPPHIVEKLVEVAQRPDTHGYSSSKGIRACAAPSRTGIAAATRWTSIPTAKPSSPSAPRKAWRT
jgi:alanine-synthesizing transaminase